MKCTKCSAEIADNMAFCGNCGAPKSDGNYQNETGNKKAKKKGTKTKNTVLSLVVMAVVFTVTSKITENAFKEENTTTSAITTVPSSSVQQTTSSAFSSEYEDIFLSRYIVEPMSFFFGLEEESFAKVYENGNVEKIALGCDGDVVKEMYNVVYIPVTGYTTEQKMVLEQEVAQTYGDLAAYEFCKATYEMGNDYYRLSFDFKELDNVENIAVLAQFGFLSESADLISLSKTRSGLAASGYVKK